jgi:hypothetical protein
MAITYVVRAWQEHGKRLAKTWEEHGKSVAKT